MVFSRFGAVAHKVRTAAVFLVGQHNLFALDRFLSDTL